MLSFFSTGFKHRYTVTSTPLEEKTDNSAIPSAIVPPKSPGTSRLRLLSCKHLMNLCFALSFLYRKTNAFDKKIVYLVHTMEVPITADLEHTEKDI